MKISKDLIEKYHRNECSQEESDAVETWLFSSDSDEALQLPLGESKTVHKAEIWKDIESILPAQDVPVQQLKPNVKRPFWLGAAAASLVIGISLLVSYTWIKRQNPPMTELLSINNTSSVHVRQVEESGYRLSIGTNTSAVIDNLSGVVDLHGCMLISPKRDIELSFEGSDKKVTFKSGQSYIVLKGKDGHDKVFIVSEKNLIDLPPVLQKQIINEFKI